MVNAETVTVWSLRGQPQFRLRGGRVGPPNCITCIIPPQTRSEGDTWERDPLFPKSLNTKGFGSCARGDLAAKTRPHFRQLGGWLSEKQLPVVYSNKYNISLLGFEHLHPLDSQKFRHVLGALKSKGLVNIRKVVKPKPASDHILGLVHSADFLADIKRKWRMVKLTEMLPLVALPNMLLRDKILKPLKYHAGGTVLAAGLALERGWSINLGGGMHHASHDKAAGWCAFADITLAIKHLRKATSGRIQRFLVIDLDAHQGNGYQRDKLHFKDEDLYVLDVFNTQKFPKDDEAEVAINVAVPVKCGTSDAEYLTKLQVALEQVAKDVNPDFIIYNAGADILRGDRHGQLNVSPEALVYRDQLVFRFALTTKVPICMLLSGGYSRIAAKTVADSIQNLFKTFDLK
ncbi:hypothetical protein BSKO_00235 [Bryopsis sp. KO-2023]|nr:hypothetical protein BSKO_00235 [Bryopsis sp. KO-2023]